MNASLLTSVNSACQAVDGSTSPPVNGWAAVTPRRRAMSRKVGCFGPSVERLQLVVPLAREVVLGQAVARQVLAGDAHAPDHHAHPAIGRGVGTGRLPGGDPPQLVRAARCSSGGRSSRAGRAGPSRPSR